MFKPDAVTIAGKAKYSTVVTQDDLIGADGRCGGGPAVIPAAVPEPQPPETDGTVGQGSRSAAMPPQQPANDLVLPTTQGIALGLSECEVVRRAGQPERFDVGTDERGERAVTLSYMRGERAGIYRFREGRLFTIERVIVAEPEKPKKPVKPAKPKTAAKPAAQPAAGQAAAPRPSGTAAWPAAPQPQQPAQGAPWPSTPPMRGSQQPSG